MFFFSEFSSLGMEAIARTTFSVLRYFLAAGIGYWIFYVWKYRAWYFRKIQSKMPDSAHIKHEIAWSVLSRIIFGFVAVGVLHFIGNTSLYFDISEYGWTYLIATTIGIIILHDTYFYWIHRWMHLPRFYKTMHRIHHHSTNPTPFAAFSFHPTEAIAEAGIFPLLVLFVPLHPIALVGALMFQVVFNIYGHSGFELMPRWWVTNRFFKYFNTSVHHNYHHKEFNYNFGLYFNYWDRWMGTLDPNYNQKFYKVKDQRPSEVQAEMPIHKEELAVKN